jgi:hypothetical protein
MLIIYEKKSEKYYNVNHNGNNEYRWGKERRRDLVLGEVGY